MQTFREFFKNFPDEESCRTHFKTFRDKIGIVCRKCGCKDHYWLSTISYYKCKKCGTRTSLRSGTVMEYSKLPFSYWYMAFMMATTTKKSFSAHEMRRQIGHKFYQPIWEMAHKIRIVMGKRDSEYLLKDVVEVDEGFFVTVPERLVDDLGNKIPKEDLKRGKGSQRSAKVLVMTESIPNADNKNKHRPDAMVKHIKMIHIPDTKAETIVPEIDVNVSSDSTVVTDGANHYNKLNSVIKNHIAINMTGKKADKYLPWVHKVISNCKRNILGVHHAIGQEYTQNYLNEFCFKFNRRFNGLNTFDRLLNVAVQYKWD